MKPERYTVSRPGIEIVVPDRKAAVSMAIAGLPNAKIKDMAGKDVTAELLDIRTFEGKFTVVTPAGDTLVLPFNYLTIAAKSDGGDC